MSDITINITKMTQIEPPPPIPPIELSKEHKQFMKILTRYEVAIKNKKRIIKRLEDIIKQESLLEIKLNDFYKEK